MKFLNVITLISFVCASDYYPTMHMYSPELGITETKLIKPLDLKKIPVPKQRTFNILLNGKTPLKVFNWMSQLTLWLVKIEKSNVVTMDFNNTLTAKTKGRLLTTELKNLDKNPSKVAGVHLITFEEGCDIAIEAATLYNTNVTQVSRITCVNSMKAPKLLKMAKYSEIITARRIKAKSTGANVIYYVTDPNVYRFCPGCIDEAPMLYYIESIWNRNFKASKCTDITSYAKTSCKESEFIANMGVPQTKLKTLDTTFCVVANIKAPYATGRTYINPTICEQLTKMPDERKRTTTTTQGPNNPAEPVTENAIEQTKNKLLGWLSG